jgi:uncharacterized protein YjbI with pentapeptide repeats
MGLAKKRGEFLALAEIHNNNGGAKGGAVLASLSVGALTRKFAVIPEEYTDGRFKAFKSKVLDWDKTLFDPKWNPNGVKPKETYGAEGILAKPEVFDYQPSRNGGGGEVTAGPASPLPMAFDLTRSEKVGTFGDKWLKTAWPGFPEDFDFSVFNLAQEKQRLKVGYFRGDEAVVLQNVHPTIATLKVALPGLKPRVIVKTSQPKALVQEATVNLDTIWLFPGVETALLMWRSVIPVPDEKNSGVELVAVALERLTDKPATMANILERAEKDESLEPAPPAEKTLPQPEEAKASPPPESPPAAKAPKAPEVPEVPEVAPPPPPENMIKLAQPVNAMAVLAMAKSHAERSLPEINEALKKAGLRPMTMDDLNPHLEKHAKLMETVEKEMKNAKPVSEEAMAKSALLKQGLSPEKADNFIQGVKTPVPLRSAFESDEAFKLAAEAHGQKVAALMGLPKGAAESLTQKTLALSSKDPLLQSQMYLSSEQAQTFKKAFLGPNPRELGLTSPPIDWAKAGIDPVRGVKIESFIKSLTATAEANKFAPWAARMASLKSVGAEMDKIMGLKQGSMVENIEKQSQMYKEVAWGSDEVGQSLLTLGLTPEGGPLLKVMPELDKLRKKPPAEAESLRDLAVMAGLAVPALLDRLIHFDPLNAQTLAKSRKPIESPPPVEYPPPQAKADPEEPPETLVFKNRQMVAERLGDPEASFAKASLVGLDLKGLNFVGRDLSQADLRESDLSEVNFTGANLTEALLEGANLTGATLNGATLIRANLTAAKVEGLEALKADFTGADLIGLDLSTAKLGTLKAPKAIITQTILPTNLIGYDLTDSRLNKIDLSGRDLTGSQLGQAYLCEVNLTDAALKGADLAKATFERCQFKNANLSEVQGTGLRIFASQDLGQAKFQKADLTGFLLVNTAATGTNFQGVKADGANLQEVSLTGSDWRGASLKETVFFRSDLSRAKLTKANLFKAVLGGAVLKGADFGGASLYGADLYRAEMDSLTNLKGADLNSTLLNVK